MDPEPFFKSYFDVLKQCFGSGSAQIRIKKSLLDPNPHGQMRIRVQEVKKRLENVPVKVP